MYGVPKRIKHGGQLSANDMPNAKRQARPLYFGTGR